MKLALLVVGKAKGPLAAPIEEYERRARRYYPLEVIEVREHPSHQAGSPAEVMAEEGRRLLARVPQGMAIVALDRRGTTWSSEELSAYLAKLALHASPGAAFLIGGAFGLSDEVLARADRLLSLSAFTMPHDLARLVLAEQLYRAGTISRGEPYHKGATR